jgi:proteic killer suppression protein
MIQSFSDPETEMIFLAEVSRKLPPAIQRTARRKLIYLNEADRLSDFMAPSGNRLESLKGARSGQHSIRINDQWRICFLWGGSDAIDVKITDYH